MKCWGGGKGVNARGSGRGSPDADPHIRSTAGAATARFIIANLKII